MPNGYAPEEVPLVGTRSDELGALKQGVFVDDWADVLPHGLPLGCSIVLRGRPGAGKSRVGYRLASKIGTVTALALEMGKKLSKVTAEEAGAIMASFWWYDDLSGIDELRHVNPAVVIVDSVQKLGRYRMSTVTKLRRWAVDNDRNLILVSQKNTKGSSRNGEDDDFDCDMVVDVEKAKNEGVLRNEIHLHEDKRTTCKDGCAHLSIYKSRVCDLVAFDAPLVRGF